MAESFSGKIHEQAKRQPHKAKIGQNLFAMHFRPKITMDRQSAIDRDGSKFLNGNGNLLRDLRSFAPFA